MNAIESMSMEFECPSLCHYQEPMIDGDGTVV